MPIQFRLRFLQILLLAIAAAGSHSSTAHAQLKFNFTPAGGMSQQAIDGFKAAGDRWSAIFNDNVTVNIDIDFTPLGSGILGQASSSQGTIDYASARASMVADAKSADDLGSTAALQPGSNLKLLINRTSTNPNGPGSAVPYFDATGANTNTIRMTLANAKALDLWPANDPTIDAAISFSSAFTWDFNPSDGITAGAFDFVGVATHEIGHALGFISGVDFLDTNPGSTSNSYRRVTPMDLFRFSTRSIDTNSSLLGAAPGGPGVIDWTADNTDKYFSVDGGATPLALFSNGVNFGDGRQASHWKDSLGIGIMDPTAAPGEQLAISTLDRRLMDVIGWDLAPVPEPSGLALGTVALVSILYARRRRWAIAA